MSDKKKHWWIVGCYHNGIVRSDIGAAILPATCEGYPSQPVPFEFVEQCQYDAACKYDRPIGSGWVQVVVEARGRSSAISEARSLGPCFRLTEDRGDVSIVVLDDGSWQCADYAQVLTVTGEDYGRLCEGHIEADELNFDEAASVSSLSIDKAGLRDILTDVFGEGREPSEDGVDAHIRGMTRDELVGWIDSVMMTIAQAISNDEEESA